MTPEFEPVAGGIGPWLVALAVVCRATAGLVMASVMRPGRPAAICRRTGKVRPR